MGMESAARATERRGVMGREGAGRSVGGSSWTSVLVAEMNGRCLFFPFVCTARLLLGGSLGASGAQRWWDWSVRRKGVHILVCRELQDCEDMEIVWEVRH